ncbi:MAG: reverse transcriptase-like protein [Candidatus Shikimatogenerans bostrichidophilus]|nr:MAG: reverse transcriptase-like protein [Candidatus Shikimatogenerans bostrichidophilus]
MKFLVYYCHFINRINLYNYLNIYTDGSSSGNPGPGGIGIIIQSNNFYKEYSYKFRYTTNNRMELFAIIYAIKKINKFIYLKINIYSDSKYIINIINRNFKIKKNYDLWYKLFKFNIKIIKFNWIRGHNNNYYNEKCNVLAQKAIKNKNKQILIDSFYENI